MLAYLEARVVRPLIENQILLVVCITTMVVMLGFGIISPVLPLYAQSFGVGTAMIGLTITVFGAARLVMNLPAGFLSERYGRRLLLVGGPAVTALGSLAGGLAPTFGWLIASRFVAGAGSAIYMTGAMILLTDITTDENRGRLMSIFQGSLLAGVSLGPAVGGFVAEGFGLAAPFFLVAALAGVATLWSFARMPETVHLSREQARAAAEQSRDETPPRQTARQSVLSLLARPDFLLVSMLTMSIFLTRTGGRLTLLPLVGANRLDMSPGLLGLIFAMMTVLQLIVLVPGGTMIDKLGRKALIVPSALVTGVALVLFALSGQVWMFIMAAVIHGFGTGILGPAPAAYAADIAPPGMRGVTMGLYRTFGDAGFVIGPVALGGLADLTGFGPALAFNAMVLVSVAMMFAIFARETLRRPVVPQPQAGAV
ncbi:MAG: MFS transporter [Chloroflexi bacterium]|nr:MFS transporter [Chloroflexota bacterium]